MFNLLLSVGTVWEELCCRRFGGTCSVHLQDRREYGDEVGPGVQLHIYLTLVTSEINMEKACSSGSLAKVSRPKNRFNIVAKHFWYISFLGLLARQLRTVHSRTFWVWSVNVYSEPLVVGRRSCMGERFKRRNGWELITEASNPVWKQSRKSVV